MTRIYRIIITDPETNHKMEKFYTSKRAAEDRKKFHEEVNMKVTDVEELIAQKS